LGRGGFGEVWKCEAPGGLLKAIKLVSGGLHALDANAPAQEELRAIERIKAIRHPFLLSMERVERNGDELAIVLELADRSLADLLAARKADGKPGIPREALLSYLREAAEALDVLNQRHGLMHLDIKPQNLFLVSNHVKVGDFGLVQNVTGGAPNAGLGAVTPLYASPEVFQGAISPTSDQYSLAVVYMELLTGCLPFTGRNPRQLMLQHVQGEPDLSPLPEGDRPSVARALAKRPSDRFASCTDFVAALEAGNAGVLVSLPLEDTRKAPAARTVRTRSVPPARPPQPAGSGIEALELVSRTPLTEVWRARGPDGAPRLVTAVFGCAGPGDPGITRLVGLRHPSILPIEVLSHTPGRLVLSQPAPGRTLRDVLQECQAQGRPGVPRRELLGYLRAAAEVLEHFAHQGLQHLGLNPRSIVLDGGRALLQGMGLAQLVWLPASQNVAQMNARYSAPELSLRRLSPSCDQYSLALIYHEMLTGSLPAPGKPAARGEAPVPCLDRLPAGDRVLIGRALGPSPDRRWESVLALVRALESATPPGEDDAPRRPAPETKKAPAAREANGALARFGTNLPPEVVRSRLERFRQQWKAEVASGTGSQMAFEMPAPRSLWQRWTGAQPTLRVEVEVGEPEVDAPAGVQTRSELRLAMTARGCSAQQADEILRVQGPLLIESLRQHLLPGSHGRRQERLPWNHSFSLTPLLSDGLKGPSIECQGKDISLNGIGFYMQGSLPSAEVSLSLPRTPQTPQMTMSARVVRAQACGDGWIEVGAVLLPPDELPDEGTT
jgi:serine/threonine protein kinase